MSTGLNCLFQEVAPGKWFYILESGFAPKNAWDWREYAHAYGPFRSLERAEQHLSDTQPNPGGWNINEYKDGYKPDAVMSSLIKIAMAA